nr:retrovirus-related Pol polyprotein from transposon TNT 1-94 [Tanacetum cinerariifolium]
EQALKVDAGDSSYTRGRGRGRYSYRGRGRGRGRQSFNKETIECYNCHKLGHYSYECPIAKEANYAGFDEHEEIMLMADGGVEENGFMAQRKSESKGLLWFLDSGCSNHMCGNKESEDADETAEQKTDECMYSSDDDIAKLWHERLGNISKTGMKTLQHKRMKQKLGRWLRLFEQTEEESISLMILTSFAESMELKGN